MESAKWKIGGLRFNQYSFLKNKAIQEVMVVCANSFRVNMRKSMKWVRKVQGLDSFYSIKVNRIGWVDQRLDSVKSTVVHGYA